MKKKNKGIFLPDFCDDVCEDEKEAIRTEKLIKQRLVKGFFKGMTKVFDGEVYIFDRYAFLNEIYSLVDRKLMKTATFYRSPFQKKVMKIYGAFKQKS